MNIKHKITLLFLLLSTFLFAAKGFGNLALPQQNFLSPEEAFKVTVKQGDKSITVDIALGENIYIYANKLKFKISKPTKHALQVTLPKPEKHGEFDIYHSLKVTIPLTAIAGKVSGDYTFTVELTGCSDSGICYQPQVRHFNFKYAQTDEGIIAKITRLAEEGNTGKIAEVIASESSLFILLLFFIFGLLLSLTPCIFPMIPILSSIIVSQAGKETKPSVAKAFITSLIYVVSMALAYTVVGVVAGLIGADIQAAFANPWVVILFALVFVALAFSLFGYFEIGLPQKWQSRLSSASDNAQGKGILGTAIMGVLSALIIGPCVAPPLGGAILFISHTGDALLGGLALFVMSMGMGIPLLIVGLGAGKFMPKPGTWMVRISQVFGVLMLAMAIYMINRLIPFGVTMFLIALLLMGSAIYMGVFDDSGKRKGAGKLIALLSFVLLLYGAMLFIGSLSGSHSLLNPLDQFTGSKVAAQTAQATDTKDRSAHQGYSIERLEKEIKVAHGKPVVVDIGKEGCAACTELELITFPNPAVKEELKRFVFIKIDITKNTPEEQALLKKYQVFGAPNILFFDSNGTPQPDKFITGFRAPEKFVEDLKGVR